MTHFLSRRLAAFFLVVFSVSLFSAAMADDRKVKLKARLGQDVILSGSKDKVYLRIDLEGFLLKKDEDRSAVNVALVIDRSGSMRGQRLEQAKKAAKLAVSFLNEDDIISIISYSDKAEIVVPATKAMNRQDIKNKIDQLRSNGMTALYAGVKRGGQELEKFLEVQNVNRVILLSDGMANIGPRSPAALGALGTKLAEKGISVTTLGLGLGYNEDLMEKLALSSDGNHAFIEHSADLAKVFGLEFGTVLSVIANDIEIVIHCRNGVKPIRALGRRSKIKGSDIVLHYNQLYSQDEKYVVVELDVDEDRFGADAELVDVDVRYKNLVTKNKDALNTVVRLQYSADKAAVKKSLKKEVMTGIVEQISILRNEKAVKLKDKGKLKEARKAFQDNALYLEKQADVLQAPLLKKMQKQNLGDAEAAKKSARDWGKHRKGLKYRNYQQKSRQKY